MPNDALRNAVLPKPTADEQLRSFPKMLEAQKAQIAAALPKHMNADRMARIALTCYRQTPQLAECEPVSVFACVIQGAQLGLEPGLNGRAYLIPYFNKTTRKMICTFVPGWKGMVELANRTGRTTVWTEAVYEGDDFDFQMGDSPFIRHRPGSGDRDPRKMTHAYSVGRIKGSDWPVLEVWNRARIEAHRDRYNRQGGKHYSFKEWEMYARKIPLLQVLKYMPSSPELETAIALDNDAARGAQNISIDDALEGSWVPVAGDDEDETGEGAGTAGAADLAGDGSTRAAVGGLSADSLIATMRSRKNVDDLDADASLIPTVEGEAEQKRARDEWDRLRRELNK